MANLSADAEFSTQTPKWELDNHGWTQMNTDLAKSKAMRTFFPVSKRLALR